MTATGSTTLHRPLDADRLYRHTDLSSLEFATTAELSTTAVFVGQTRAGEAMRFALDCDEPGYNLFITGEPEATPRDDILHWLESCAATRPPPPDLCCIDNFSDISKPRLLSLPAGRGVALRADMQQLIDTLEPTIVAAFDHARFRTSAAALRGRFSRRENTTLKSLRVAASVQGLALLHSSSGYSFLPLQGDSAMSAERFDAMPEPEKSVMAERISGFDRRLRKKMDTLIPAFRELQEQLRELGAATISAAVRPLIDDLKQRYADQEEVIRFLDDVLAEIVTYGESLHELSDEREVYELSDEGLAVQRFQINVLVDNSACKGAPVVVDDRPTHPNLIGRIDYVIDSGMQMTNFMLIRAGTLHRAIGGYLVLDTTKILSQALSWDALKTCLTAGMIQIESLERAIGLGSALCLEPQAASTGCKVILIGTAEHYRLLSTYDDEFADLFKVVADFAEDIDRSSDNTLGYAHYVAERVRRSNTRPLNRDALARLLEQLSREAGDAGRISASRRTLDQLLIEAHHAAAQSGHEFVQREDVETAIAARERRHDRLRDLVQDDIRRNLRLIDCAGEQTGQVNGLAVVEQVDFSFAHPVRITANVWVGEGNVIDIERETELGGAIHSKGVMILSSFLAARFSSRMPLSLSASLVFEQSYGPVEGDSASLAELCALLSALAATPIHQSLAVTGSVNQFGLVQAIGSVNEKIEGFFDTCRHTGLTGRQGVLIPEANISQLMLRSDVVSAAQSGNFHIYAVSTVDQAIEILTGVPIGAPDDNGLVAEGTINYLVAIQLDEMSQARENFSSGKKRAPARRSHRDGKR